MLYLEDALDALIDNMMDMLQKAKEEVLLDKEIKINEPQKFLKLNNSYTYDLQTNKLYNNKIIVKLSKKESEVLEVLITNIGELISLDRFKQEIWNNVDINDSSFRTVMKRLKDKIKDDDFILSQKGYGYIIEKVLDK